MGLVKTTKQSNESYLLEITYGGVEAPFGGIDTSAPPAYIDPKCFVDSEGFLISDNKLVATSFKSNAIPSNVFNNVTGVTIIGAGNFYSSVLGVQLNYLLGEVCTPTLSTLVPAGVRYDFYMSYWNDLNPTVAVTQILSTTLYDAVFPAIAATLTLSVIGTNATDFGAASLTQNIFPFGAYAGGNAGGTVSGQTKKQMVINLVNAILAQPGTCPITAAPTYDGLGLTLTAKVPGAAGNGIEVQDASTNITGGLYKTPVFYCSDGAATFLSGGADSYVVQAPRNPVYPSASICEVGGILYIANVGPFMLKFTGAPGGFQILTTNNGARVLSKFAGSLVGLELVPQLGTFTQSKEMIFIWSSALNLGEWSPVDINGFVTGAGFAQIADISDYLTGLIISNNTAWILRTQGLSYATATANGVQPFTFANVALGDSGEGAPIASLVTQYDQMGVFVGNSNIYGVSQSLSPIGNKIKNAFFKFLSSLPDPMPVGDATVFMSAISCGVFIGNDEYVYYLFMLGNIIYIFNAASQTWMKMSFNLPTGTLSAIQGLLAVFTNSSLTTRGAAYRQSLPVLVQGIHDSSIVDSITPVAYTLIEGIAPVGNTISGSTQVTFPIEEIMFGREISIDALLISLNAYIPTDTVTLDFEINGNSFSFITLTPAQFGIPLTSALAPTILQLFPNTSQFSAINPQLSITVTTASASICNLWISKVSIFGSFDPNQRPV